MRGCGTCFFTFLLARVSGSVLWRLVRGAPSLTAVGNSGSLGSSPLCDSPSLYLQQLTPPPPAGVDGGFAGPALVDELLQPPSDIGEGRLTCPSAGLGADAVNAPKIRYQSLFLEDTAEVP